MDYDNSQVIHNQLYCGRHDYQGTNQHNQRGHLVLLMNSTELGLVLLEVLLVLLLAVMLTNAAVLLVVEKLLFFLLVVVLVPLNYFEMRINFELILNRN